VPVNGLEVHHVENNVATTYLRVRIKDYHGLPKGSPSSSPYFSIPLHTSDRYSIAYSFVPKANISGTDLIMGFDFSHPVRDRLPPGTKTAVKIATTILDPGLYADPYSDEPYLYGPALSSFFTFRVGELVDEESSETQLARLDSQFNGVIEEGGESSGSSIRELQQIPSTWKARRKFFLDTTALKKFVFEKGRMYHADFFNPHLDFSNFSLRLPGFSICVAKYVDEKTHHLRFVLKKKESGEISFVVFFKLLFGKELEDTLKTTSEGDDSEESIQTQAVQNQAAVENRENILAAEPKRKSTQREILGGTRAPSFQEPKGFVASESFTREDESDYMLNAAVKNLAQSISTAFAAMGFGKSSSSDSDIGDGSSTIL
jgi:hypothetical protein